MFADGDIYLKKQYEIDETVVVKDTKDKWSKIRHVEYMLEYITSPISKRNILIQITIEIFTGDIDKA